MNVPEVAPKQGRASMSDSVAIYALLDPRDKKTRYIGQSADPGKRLEQHMAALRARGQRSVVQEWLRALCAAGLTPTLVELEHVPRAEASSAEARHVEEHLRRGCKLTNRTTPRTGLDLGARISADVGPAVYKALMREAEERSCTLSWLVRTILQDHVASVGSSMEDGS